MDVDKFLITDEDGDVVDTANSLPDALEAAKEAGENDLDGETDSEVTHYIYKLVKVVDTETETVTKNSVKDVK